MTEPADSPPRLSQILVVAIEYVGEDVPAVIGSPRRPLLEHAYDLSTGTMPAHLGHSPRVGFPDPRRGWPTTPRVTRCAGCTLAVTDLVRDLVADLFTATRMRFAAWFAQPPAELLLFPTLAL